MAAKNPVETLYRKKYPYHVRLTHNVAGGAFIWLHLQCIEAVKMYNYSSEFEIDTTFYDFFFVDELIAIQFKLANWEDHV